MVGHVLHSSMDLTASLKAATAATSKLATTVALAIDAIVAAVTALPIWSSRFMMVVVLLVVWGVALLVYREKENFGEAALALVAGLLTAYSVPWTPMRFIAFIVAWVSFSGGALFISGRRNADRIRGIYMDGASYSVVNACGGTFLAECDYSSKIKRAFQRLRDVGKKTHLHFFEPIQRAEIVRFFCYRRVPIDLIGQLLLATEVVSLTSRLEPLRIAGLFADFTKIHTRDLGPSEAYSEATDTIDTMEAALKLSGASPDDFVTAIECSRHIMLESRFPINTYLFLLKEALDSGVTPQDVSAWLAQKSPVHEVVY